MKQIPLYEQIYEEIREKIEERGYRVGDRLPSEKELSEQYHVSRITSKKAVELLAEAGHKNSRKRDVRNRTSGNAKGTGNTCG